MPAHTFQISVKNTLTLKSHQNKPLPIVVVFVNDEGQILGNLGDAQYISRATALIQQSHFKGTLGKSVTDYAFR